MPRRKRINWSLWVVLAAIATVFACYAIGWPLSEHYWQVADPFVARPTLAELIRQRTMEALAAGWFITLGGVVGSFMNVVVYRAPLGKSFVAGASSCPYCCTPIQATDNVPVLGWIKLRGRCRTCRLPIAARYPCVELIVAILFGLLYFVELLSAAGNLPGGARHPYTGVAWTVFSPKFDVISLYLWHCFLICVLLVWALIGLDGHRLPLRTVVIAWIIGFACAACVPILHPVAWLSSRPGWLPQWPLSQQLETSIAGLVFGLVCGAFTGLARRTWSRQPHNSVNRPFDVAVAMATVGLFLGWQAAASVGLLSMALGLVVALLSRLGWNHDRATTLFVITLSSLLHVCLWQVTSWTKLWPGPDAELPGGLIAIAAACVLAAGAGFLKRADTVSTENAESSIDVLSS